MTTTKTSNYQPAGVIDITTVGNIDDLNIGTCSLLIMNNATAATIRGIKAGYPGHRLTIYRIGAGTVTLAHENVSSSAANRLNNGISANVRLQIATNYQYDSVSSRWKQITDSKGWQGVTFNAGDFTGSVGAWTVTAPNVTTFRYLEKEDNSMKVNIFIQNTNVAVGGGTLDVLIPNGRISATTCAQPCFVYDASITQQAGFVLMAIGSNKLNFFSTPAGGTFAATALNNTTVIAFVEFEVQP